MITAADLDTSVFTADSCTAGSASTMTAPRDSLRQPIPGLAAARTTGVNHEHLAEVMTHAVRRVYGTVPAWWSLTAFQTAQPGQPWPLATVLVDDELIEPLGDIARGWANIVNCPMPWEQLSTVLSAPGIFAYVGSPRFDQIEEIDCGFNVVINGGLATPQDPASTFVGRLYDPAMPLTDRVLAAQTDAAEYAEYRGFSFVAKAIPGRRTVPRCSWTDICGYRIGANLINIEITGSGRGHSVKEAQQVRENIYGLLHAYNGPSPRMVGQGLDFVAQVHG